MCRGGSSFIKTAVTLRHTSSSFVSPGRREDLTWHKAEDLPSVHSANIIYRNPLENRHVITRFYCGSSFHGPHSRTVAAAVGGAKAHGQLPQANNVTLFRRRRQRKGKKKTHAYKQQQNINATTTNAAKWLNLSRRSRDKSNGQKSSALSASWQWARRPFCVPN